MKNSGRIRWAVQIGFAVLTIWVGYDFVVFYHQAIGGGPVTATRPPGVEAFLPISALLAAKRLLLAGVWDEIHPAGLTLLLAFVAGAFIARRAFCSWICPIGLASRVLEVVRRKVLRLAPRSGLPRWLSRLAPIPKYLLLAVFIGVTARMSLDEIDGFLHQPYNIAADGAMLVFFTHLSVTALVVIALLGVFSLVFRNGWCRVLCPYGALIGLAGVFSPLRVVRNPEACRYCGACTRACPSGIRVSELKTVHSLECTACLSCLDACKFAGALDVRSHWGNRIRPLVMPGAAVAVFFLAVGIAMASGHWQSQMVWQDFKMAYLMGRSVH